MAGSAIPRYNYNNKQNNIHGSQVLEGWNVCREDVWNFAPNLIHVRPYHFFKHTGDINAPPGLTKQVPFPFNLFLSLSLNNFLLD